MQQPAQSPYKLLSLLSALPLSFLQGLAKGLAFLALKTFRKKTLKTVYFHLDIALPHLDEQQKQQLSRQAAIHEMMSYVEFVKIWGSSTAQNIRRIHHLEGEQYLQQAIAEKKGVVLIVPHFGTWEVMNAWVSQFSTMTIMYKPLKDAKIDRYVRQARGRERATLVPTDESGVKQIFRALKQGGTTAILPDHSPDIESDLTPWFGVPLYSSQLTAKMIQKTKAKALLLYAIRNNNAGFDMFIEPISDDIYTAPNGMVIIHQAIEQLARRYPQHYHWIYKRFKASPDTRNIYDLPYLQAIEKIRELQQNR